MSYCSYCDKQVGTHHIGVDLEEPADQEIVKYVFVHCNECERELYRYER